MVDSAGFASLVEVAGRSGRSLGRLERQARSGVLPARRDRVAGWVLDRELAEWLIAAWSSR